MQNPALLLPSTMKALQTASGAGAKAGVPEAVLELVHLRVSQINGCALCLSLDAPRIIASGQEGIERALLVAGWREAPCFDKAERAALALAEAVTRQADHPDSVTDEIWADAAACFDEQQLAGLLVHISIVNVWNRLNASTRQLAGSFTL